MLSGSLRNGACLAVLLVGVGACRSEEQGKGGGPPGKQQRTMTFSVEAEPVRSRKVQYVVDAVGSVEAFERVQVTARVPGVVELVKFAEGDRVKEGQVILEIEPERYRVAVEQAEAALARAQALKADAEAGLARREDANKQSEGMYTAEEVQIWRTRLETSRADIATASGALDLARLNLRDARVRSPLSGVIQTREVQTGQYVQPGTVLATLVRREPLLLRFAVPEIDAARLLPGMNATFRVRGSNRALVAKIAHVADAADPATRMVAATARIDGPDAEGLRPGAFAQVVVPVGASEDAPVIPQTAVRPSERGFLAFVIENDKARERTLTLGMRTAEGDVEVRVGLQAGEMLVVRGTEALKDGTPVKVVPAEKRGPEAPPLESGVPGRPALAPSTDGGGGSG